MTDVRTFTNDEKHREIVREIGLRRRVYGNWVRDGRMGAEQAKRQIAIMEAIERDYVEAMAKERLI